MKTNNQQAAAIAHYYRWHAHLYDSTRWAFLFGRSALLNQLPTLPKQPRILDLGCGTGSTISLLLNQFPNALVTGVDVSGTMLKKAAHKFKDTPQVQLRQLTYGIDSFDQRFDAIISSYTLTMAGEHQQQIIEAMHRNLTENAVVAVVDFNKTPVSLFERWMRFNHVRMQGRLLPLLESAFAGLSQTVQPVYGGLWSYFIFVGSTCSTTG